MLVDMRMVKAQTDYKREQLSKSYKSSARKEAPGAKRASVGAWRGLRARKASAV